MNLKSVYLTIKSYLHINNNASRKSVAMIGCNSLDTENRNFKKLKWY